MYNDFYRSDFGIHTFTISYHNLTNKEYRRLYEMFKKHICEKAADRSYIKTDILYSEGFCGIYPKLFKKNGHCYMSIIVTPESLVENDRCTIEIFADRNDSVTENMIFQINRALAFISDENNAYTFENAVISRVDLCVNFLFDNFCIVKQYLKLADRSCCLFLGRRNHIHNRNRVVDKEADKHSFSIYNSNFELTVYDKEYQLSKFNRQAVLNEAFGNILRVEVKMKREFINDHTQKFSGNKEKLKYLLENSRDIMIRCVSNSFPAGDYYSYKNAEEIIENSRYNRKTKRLMKEIIKSKKNIVCIYDELQDKYSLSVKKIYRLKKKFAECGLVPVKISAKDSADGKSVLPGFTALLSYDPESGK